MQYLARKPVTPSTKPLQCLGATCSPVLDPTAYCPIYACMASCRMKRTALFLKEEQIEKLQKLSDKTGAPLAELIRRAIDRYQKERAKELK